MRRWNTVHFMTPTVPKATRARCMQEQPTVAAGHIGRICHVWTSKLDGDQTFANRARLPLQSWRTARRGAL
jgi:hypothetical protein